MKVKRLIFNWYQTGSTVEREGAGEDYSYYEVGRGDVTAIIENKPRNGNQVWNYLVINSDGTKERIFNPNIVEYF